NPNELNQDDARYGFRCCHLKNIWTAPLPPETELSRQMTTSTTSIDIMGLQAAYANLHTDQERDYFRSEERFSRNAETDIVCRLLRDLPSFPTRRSSDLNPNELNQDDARYGFRCCHLKNIWTAPLPPETELSRQMTTSTTSIDIMGLQAAYANLHTDQERDYF